MKLSEINPINIYNHFINKVDQSKNIIRKKESDGFFNASTAGLCLKKHWYQANKYDTDPIPDTSRRLMRLGTIVGEDIENAMHYFSDDLFINPNVNNIEIFTEKHIISEKYNISGHFDLLIVDTDTNEGALFDYKTANSYKFKKLFGRNPDNSPWTNYEYQLGTYALILEESKEFCSKIIKMTNIYMNKDNSVMKSKEAPLEYIDFARKYWEKVNKISKKEMPEPPFGHLIPFYTPQIKRNGNPTAGECGRWCMYSSHCDSPFKKDKGTQNAT